MSEVPSAQRLSSGAVNVRRSARSITAVKSKHRCPPAIFGHRLHRATPIRRQASDHRALFSTAGFFNSNGPEVGEPLMVLKNRRASPPTLARAKRPRQGLLRRGPDLAPPSSSIPTSSGFDEASTPLQAPRPPSSPRAATDSPVAYSGGADYRRCVEVRKLHPRAAACAHLAERGFGVDAGPSPRSRDTCVTPRVHT
jgi:hypothetical protein